MTNDPGSPVSDDRFERPCPYAPGHRPDASGCCTWCLNPVPEPWLMRSRLPPAQLVAKIAAKHGDQVGATAAKRIAEALLSYADEAVSYRQRVSYYAWRDPKYVEHARRRMRQTLLVKVADEGLLPVALPSESLRYFGWSPGAPHSSATSEIPAEIVEEGYEWFEVEIELRVPARRADPTRGTGRVT